MTEQMKSFVPVIKWSGSKRLQAAFIFQHFPTDFETYYEPFVGGGAVLYAACPSHAIAGDVCAPLIELWKVIQRDPDRLVEHYSKHWQCLQNEGYPVFYAVRDRFNINQDPSDLFFLSRTCVNGLIRFNSNGEFNNSLHHTRKGVRPETAAGIIRQWSTRLAHVQFLAGDYRQITQNASVGDLVYLDPPYFHTKGRYYGNIDFGAFLDYLEGLNSKGVRFILSFDGKRGDKTYKTSLPDSLYSRKFLVPSGNSPFKKVMENKSEMVEEALYINW